MDFQNLFWTKSIEQSIADTDEPGRKLKRSLSTWDLMIISTAVAVGAGILSVKAAANFAGPAVTKRRTTRQPLAKP
ncbi:hypothetical protein BWQ92_00890 [Arthrobacter sp. QXT-31]|nr:hypothetical protein BWQ92_00890 [Arthrobacter sp. QXT-31]